MPLIAAIGLTFPAAAEDIRLKEDAPVSHLVAEGDSLMGISERFLKDPWQWPQAWRLTPEQARNPQRIHPGDVVRLVTEAGQPRLTLEPGPRFAETVKLSPRVRAEPIVIQEAGVPSIPLPAIAPLLSRSTVAAAAELERAPHILGASDARVMFAKGDTTYATKGQDAVTEWRVVRMGQAFRNPANPKEVLAYELVHLGEARTEAAGDPQLIRITRNDQEILERDRLLPNFEAEPPRYVPHAPEAPVHARVLAALGGQSQAGTWMTLVLDQGRRDGLEVGHVLGLFRAGRSVADPKCLRAGKIAFLGGGRDEARACDQAPSAASTLPDTRTGLAFVYRVFDKVAYALVLKGSEPVAAGDVARKP